MKTQESRIAKLMLGLTTIAIAAAVLCLAPSSASGKPPHGDGPGGGLPYPTASTVSQLIADLNYANSAGGAITINLAPGATFNLKSANNTPMAATGCLSPAARNPSISPSSATAPPSSESP